MRPRGATRRRSSNVTTGRSARRAAPRRWSTAVFAICRTSTSGLVREALLERQLMVRLAPHLVYPTPYLVPQLGDDRRDRKIGIGLNMYDVMASNRGSRRERREERRGRRGRRDEAVEGLDLSNWSPDRHRTIPGDEVLELIPALRSRDPRSAYLFYDCQTDDVRLVLTILGEAERFGAVMANRLEVTSLLERDGRAGGVVCRCGEIGRDDRDRGRQRRQRDRRLGRPDSARARSSTRPRCRRSRRVAART